MAADGTTPFTSTLKKARSSPATAAPANVPAWEKGRKDVYRLRPGGSVTLTMQFRDWGGMFMEHCHNTVHEDNAMLLRWEIQGWELRSCILCRRRFPTPQGVKFESTG